MNRRQKILFLLLFRHIMVNRRTLESPYTLLKLNEIIFRQKSFKEYLLELLKQGYSIIEYKNPRGDIIPYHAHASPEILIVLSGKVRVVVEEVIIDLVPEDVLIINAFAIHMLSFPELACRYFRCSID